MLFNSLQFLFVYLPIALIGFHLFGRVGRKAVIAWLALVSLVFYGMWKPEFLFFLAASITINYSFSRLIHAADGNDERKHALLWTGISLNLLALFYYKYLFTLHHFFYSAHVLHNDASAIILPLGISFFTFTQIAYLVDLSQDQAEVQDPFSYTLFVTFFPHLVAGPILHHKEIMPQFAKERYGLKLDDFARGLTWFLMGMAKKVLIADKLSEDATLVFNNPAHQSFVGAWTGIIYYSLQLYFDFSGYSDMAIGLARMFSIRFPLNFDSPYKATNIIDFWQRWHMTLTRYITVYLYNPISLNIQRRRLAAGKKISRKASQTPFGFLAMVAFPTIITMLIAGLWHGAGLQFLIFGLLHGLYLTVNHAWRIFRGKTVVVTDATEKPRRSRIKSAPPRFAGMLGVYFLVVIAQVFFRADSVTDAMHLLRAMFGGSGLGHPSMLLDNILVFCLLPVVWFLPNTQQILGESDITLHQTRSIFRKLTWAPNLGWAVAIAVLFFAVLANLDSTSSFLYFQF